MSSHTSKTGINDIFKVFKFASDKIKVEWAVHRNGDTYTIGTGHNSYSASSWEDYTNGKPNATVHSHPGIKAAVDEETFSMGYGAPYRDTDWNNVRIDVKQAREKARKSYVYFPNSGRLLMFPFSVARVSVLRLYANLVQDMPICSAMEGR